MNTETILLLTAITNLSIAALNLVTAVIQKKPKAKKKRKAKGKK
jgi:hypothetical protein